MFAGDAIVSLPDRNQPFVVETDASKVGIAAVLLQQGPCRFQPLSFISRVLSNAEKNDTVQEWECLAVVIQALSRVLQLRDSLQPLLSLLDVQC